MVIQSATVVKAVWSPQEKLYRAGREEGAVLGVASPRQRTPHTRPAYRM